MKKSNAKIPQQIEEHQTKRILVTKTFYTALAILSILGFVGTISEGFFAFDLKYFLEAILLLVVGVAILIEVKIKRLKSISHGLNSNNFSRLITTIIGLVALIAGIFSIPGIRFESPAFLATKGILALIAIVMIALQTWVIKDE